MDSKLSDTQIDPSVTSPTATQPPTPSHRLQLDLSLAQVVGGSLAAATAAALSSKLGVAGTIAGAAVISTVTAVAGALYTQSLRRTRTHVRAVTQVALRRTESSARAPEVARSAQTLRPRQLLLRPRQMIAGVVVIFGLAVAGITGFELLTGGPLSGGTGGTTLGELARSDHRSDAGNGGETPVEQPTPDPNESTAPTTSPANSTPAPSLPDPTPAPTSPEPSTPPAPTPPAGSDPPR